MSCTKSNIKQHSLRGACSAISDRLSLSPSIPQSLGLSVAAAGMFHDDGSELILHFVSQCNSELSNLLEEQQKLVQLGQAE